MFIFKDAPWLGGKHDGYPLLPFKDYRKTRLNDSLSPREHAALTQSELTFGFLEGVMEVKVPESVLVRVDSSSGRQVVTSENLPALLKDWRYRIAELGDGEPCLQWYNRVQTTFSQVSGVLSIESFKPGFSFLMSAGLEQHELADIIVQIGSILEAAAKSRAAFPSKFPPQGFSCSYATTFALETHVTDLIANGWCPFTYGIFAQSVCMLGYALTCKRPRIRESSESHAKCTRKACVRNTVDTSKCMRKHVTETCNCDNYKPSLENVVEFLRTGKIPVVQCPPPYTELLVCDSLNTPYVAISHVWADGLRSTTEEGLPECQIKRLAAMTSQLVPGGAFWIDTLCIPKIQDVRNRAIGMMAETYRGATAVLVLDSSIREISSSAPREEKALYVLGSAWMQRLWTLQEGLLALKLIFEFSDGLVAVDELLPESTRESQFNTLLIELSSKIFRLTKLRRPGPSDDPSFSISDVAAFLRQRATSNASDETLAISGLLNVDALELANLPPEERMETFLLRVRALPRSVIILGGAKLNKAGFSWAPKTFMVDGGGVLRFHDRVARCTSTGLLAEYIALNFKRTELNGNEEWCIRDASEGSIYKVCAAASIGPDTSLCCNTLLLMELPRSFSYVGCAAVLGIGKVSTDDGERVLCEFRRRLYVRDISEYELSKDRAIHTIVDGKSGTIKVKVV